MIKEELATGMITRHMNLLRIKEAENRDRENENQLCEMKAQLQALGVVVDELKIR